MFHYSLTQCDIAWPISSHTAKSVDVLIATTNSHLLIIIVLDIDLLVFAFHYRCCLWFERSLGLRWPLLLGQSHVLTCITICLPKQDLPGMLYQHRLPSSFKHSLLLLLDTFRERTSNHCDEIGDWEPSVGTATTNDVGMPDVTWYALLLGVGQCSIFPDC